MRTSCCIWDGALDHQVGRFYLDLFVRDYAVTSTEAIALIGRFAKCGKPVGITRGWCDAGITEVRFHASKKRKS